MRQTCLWIGLSLLVLGAMAAQAAGEELNIKLHLNRHTIGVGESLQLQVEVKRPDGTPFADCMVLPYVDGRRWGAHEYTDAAGKALCLLPLPLEGPHELKVEVFKPFPKVQAKWIWAPKTEDHQTVYFQGEFYLQFQPTKANLWVAVDDSATVYLDGRRLEHYQGWQDLKPFALDCALLKPGRHTFTVEAHNGSGPASLALQCDLEGPQEKAVVTSDGRWRLFTTKPVGWPKPATEKGEPVKVLGKLNEYIIFPNPWPGLYPRKRLFTGTHLPEDAITSEGVLVRVVPRKFNLWHRDKEHLVGMQWEPWFTPHNIYWQTPEAVPLLGFYSSFNAAVIRQHLLWLMESGVDFLMADWSNHIWFIDDWHKRGRATNEIILATTLTLEVMAEMRDEGLPVPKMTLLTGISHVKNGVNAVNGELDWVYYNYIRNPRFDGLWQYYLGKPLIVPLDLGASFLKSHQPVDPEGHFTVRYMSVQNEDNGLAKLGLWSWMDKDPQVTYYQGKPEAITVSSGYFGAKGWKYPPAKGHRNGATLLETFKPALEAKPHFLLLHQFNEFTGQSEGHGHGENHDHYYDIYDSELTDDMEPTSLDTPVYRGKGGWGFYYLNLTRALVDLYKQATPETTVVVLASPLNRAIVEGDELEVQGEWIGRRPETFTLLLDGKPVVEGWRALKTTLNLKGIADGRHVLKLVAPGTLSRYELSWVRASKPLAEPRPASCSVEFTLQRRAK